MAILHLFAVWCLGAGALINIQDYLNYLIFSSPAELEGGVWSGGGLHCVFFIAFIKTALGQLAGFANLNTGQFLQLSRGPLQNGRTQE